MIKDNFKSAVLSSYFYTFLTLIASIFVTRYIFNFFDNSQYGIFILIVETIAVFEILDFGFSGGMLSFLSRETNNYTRINKIVSTLFYCQLALSLIAFLSAFLIYINPSFLFPDSEIEVLSLKNGILLASFSLFFTMINKSISQVIYSRRKITKDNLIKIFSLSTRLALIFGLLHIYKSIEFLIMVLLITQLVNFICSIYLVKNLEPNIKFDIKNFDLKVLREVWNVSSWFAIGGLSIILIERFDNIMTGMLLSTASITILVITRKLFDISKSFIFQLNNNYRPYFGKMLGEKKHNIAMIKFRNLSTISVLSATIIGSGIIIINEFFIDLWVGEGKFGGIFLSLILFFNLAFHAWKITYRAFLSSNLIAKELAISSLLEGLLNLILAYILGINFGLIGIVSSTFISGFIVNSFIFLFINNKYNFEPNFNLISRNLYQLIFVVSIGFFSILISILINSLLLKLSVWIVSVLTLLFIVKIFFFKNYTLNSFIKGEIL